MLLELARTFTLLAAIVFPVHSQRWLYRHPPMRHAIASWYDDSEPLACTRAQSGMGIASLIVPCGRRVLLCHHGCVTVTVDDHGPYVAGRTFDLGPAVKARIGCSDLCWVSWRPR